MAVPFYDYTSLRSLDGKKVRLTAKVLKNRISGHLGDKFLHITPSKPNKGETIEIGVGYLFVSENYCGKPAIGLRPSDGRDTLWINPNILYRLHDQTVNIFAEETNDEESPKAEFLNAEPEGSISNGDGPIQMLSRHQNLGNKKLFLEPEVRNLGDGLFMFSPPMELFEENARLNVEIRDEE